MWDHQRKLVRTNICVKSKVHRSFKTFTDIHLKTLVLVRVCPRCLSCCQELLDIVRRGCGFSLQPPNQHFKWRHEINKLMKTYDPSKTEILYHGLCCNRDCNFGGHRGSLYGLWPPYQLKEWGQINYHWKIKTPLTEKWKKYNRKVKTANIKPIAWDQSWLFFEYQRPD